MYLYLCLSICLTVSLFTQEKSQCFYPSVASTFPPINAPEGQGHRCPWRVVWWERRVTAVVTHVEGGACSGGGKGRVREVRRGKEEVFCSVPLVVSGYLL